MTHYTKTPLEMIAEWRKGCSCAGPFYDRMMKKPEGTTNPSECFDCTEGLIDALEGRLKQDEAAKARSVTDDEFKLHGPPVTKEIAMVFGEALGHKDITGVMAIPGAIYVEFAAGISKLQSAFVIRAEEPDEGGEYRSEE